MNNYSFHANDISRGDMYYVVNNGVNTEDWKQGRPAIIVSNDVNNRNSTHVEIV